MGPTEWKRDEGKYSWGSVLMMGRICVAKTTIRSTGSRNKQDGPLFQALCNLPGIKVAEELYRTEDEAKARAERQVKAWFQLIKEPTT